MAAKNRKSRRPDCRLMTMNWQVYIILCSDNSLYTGITTDMERRFLQHKEGKGAKFFRGRQPLRVVYLEDGHCRSSAARREVHIKTMKRVDKELLVSREERKFGDSPR
jgi:putative endonuclease